MSAIAGAPALPLHKAGPYVAAAYIVFVVLVLAYVAILAVRASRIEKDVTAMHQEVQSRQDEAARQAEHEEGVAAAGRATRAPAAASPEGERGPA